MIALLFVVAALTAFVVVTGNPRMGAGQPFEIAYSALLSLSAAVIAAVLFGQSRATSQPLYRLLACAFLSCALVTGAILLGSLVSAPSEAVPLGTQSTGAYLGGTRWLAWASIVIVAAVQYERRGEFALTPGGHPTGPGPSAAEDQSLRRALAVVVTTTVLSIGLLVLGTDEVPQLLDGGPGQLRYTSAMAILRWLPLLALVGATASLVRGLVRGSRTHLWLVVTAGSLAAAQSLQAMADRPFHLGWYLGRGLVLGAFLALLLVVVVHQANVSTRLARLYRDSAAQRARADAATATLERIVGTDSLTGLLNRETFARDLGGVVRRVDPAELVGREVEAAGVPVAAERRAQEAGGRAALVMLDLDGFKLINDTYGHAVGDEVLAEVGRRLTANVRSTDRVYRLGGDEFALWMPTVPYGHADIESRLRALINAVRQPMRVGRHLVSTDLSVGVALSPDDEQGDYEALLRRADMAMYAAKHRRMGRPLFFEEALERVQIARGQLGAALDRALAERAFTYQYQPIVDLRTSQPWGIEALMRWRTDGRVRPAADFIHSAEAMGLLPGMSMSAMTDLVDDLATIQSAIGVGATVCLNISPTELSDPDMAYALLHGPLAGHSRNLALEVSGHLISDVDDQAAANLMRLRAAGYRVGVHDAGSGLASFGALRRISPSLFKIDRGFVARARFSAPARGYVAAVGALAQSFGGLAVAQGLDSVTMGDYLPDLGVALGQGIAFGPPMDADDLASWVQRRPGQVEPQHDRGVPVANLADWSRRGAVG